MPVVLIDMDGVVVDFVSFYIEIANRLFGRSHVHDDVTEWWVEKALKLDEAQAEAVYDELSKPGVAFHMVPYPDAVEGVQRICELAEVHFVTTSYEKNPTWEHDRRRWIAKHFNEELVSSTAFVRKKHRYHGDFFIDDKPDHVVEWKTKWPNNTSVLWARRYNENAIKAHHRSIDLYTQSWDCVLSAIRERFY
jgi:5'(3')-deoxyribonucleotidase